MQMARLESAESARFGAVPARGRAIRIYARRMAFLTVVGLVHAMLLWSGDVLLVYALIGFALLGLRRFGDRTLGLLIAACLLFPALSEVMRAVAAFLDGFDPVTAFEYRQLEVSNDLAFGRGSLPRRGPRDRARLRLELAFALRPLHLRIFVVQMATGILVGFVVGRRGWPLAPIAAGGAERRAAWLALVLAMACGVAESLALVAIGGTSASSSRAGANDRTRVARGVLCHRHRRLAATRPDCRAGCARCAMPAGCRSPTICCRRCSRARSSTAGDWAGGTAPAPAVEIGARAWFSSPSSCRSAAPGWRAFATGRWNTSGALHVRRAARAEREQTRRAAHTRFAAPRDRGPRC